MQAQQPPYDLPRRFAEQAQDTFDEISRGGLTPNVWHFNILMNCQASSYAQYDGEACRNLHCAKEVACKPAAPRRAAQKQRWRKDSESPALIGACIRAVQAKAGMLDAALASVERMKAQGLSPDSVTLNTLLSACKRAKQPQKAMDIMTDFTQQGDSRAHSPATALCTVATGGAARALQPWKRKLQRNNPA